MICLFVILLISLVFIVGCSSIMKSQVELSMMKLEKIDTSGQYPDIELEYVWHIIEGKKMGEIIYSYGRLNERYVPGNIAYVFVRRW